ncbi:P-loop containing nucleoside triphosphate hydrolase protein [Lasiosphaeris hirsuta]|uniref:P-loop containing nucleoside triphosphate hydrolase protein n=1 Tax=Lasiosphaeris hirsuta TaxID=260670 RepID=A0AA40DK92_9PEZI|nr:P-loop containing nucleoside triphosphate hydrolase protein [Lasiosphaeris hirsuta]
MSSNLIIPTMVHHYYLFIEKQPKDAYLVYLCKEAQRAGQTTAIFTRTISETRRVSRLLDALKIDTISLHCDLSPSARAASLDKLRRKEYHAIVTTDVAAALDPIPKVGRIINFSLTWKINHETYAQRISNIGHAGSSGQAISFVTQYDLDNYMCMERFLDVPFTKYNVDDDIAMSSCRGQVEEAASEDPSLKDTDYCLVRSQRESERV